MPCVATGSVLACSHSLRTVDMRGEDTRARLRAAVEPRTTLDASDLLRFRTVADIACSADGSRVAFTVTVIDAEADEYGSTIWTASAHGGDPAQLTKGPKKDSAPRWSPDGTQIAFLSDGEHEKPQLYVMRVAGLEARRLTDLPLGAMPAAWSPDGTRLLFSARIPVTNPPADADGRKRWEQRPRHVTRAQYKADGQGYTFDARSHLFVADVATGTIKQITDGDTDDRAESWSPDGTRIVWARNRAGRNDYNQTDLFSCAADGTGARQLTHGVGRPISPTWSPDGTRVAFYAYDEATPWIGDPMVRPWIVSLDSQSPRPLTKRFDYGVALLPPPAITPGPAWSPDGTSVTSCFAVRGDVRVVRVRVSDGATETIVGGERQVVYLASAPGTRLAYIAGDPRDPSEAFVANWDGTGEHRVTRLNDALVAELGAVLPVRRTFDTEHGDIEGWVIVPKSGRPAPLLVDIHGGPAGFAGDVFSLGYFFKYVLASRGWAVLSLNPTGSGSYGLAHAHGIRGRWGQYDLPEQIAAVET